MILKTFGNVLIIGDSYSTFDGYIPKNYRAWYPKDIQSTDVDDVKDTWWWQLIQETNSTLVLNESFSGTTVCNTEREEIPHTSFYYRLENKLIADDFFNNHSIDTIFVFGGTNDSWINAPVGDEENIKHDFDSLKQVLPAFDYILQRLQTVAPKSKIVAIINSDIKESIQMGFANICNRLGVTYIPLKAIQKQNGHPNKAGMKEIKEQILESLIK